MARLTYAEMNSIKEKYNVGRLWSWSRFNCYNNSKYEYFLKYILKKPEDRQDCIYTVTGGLSHEIMESLYLNKIKYEEMDENFENAWLTADIAELKFDRNDTEKNKKISAKYYDCLKHFFNNHNVIPYKLAIEKFVTARIGKYVFQGYIDACFRDNDNCINILDWKTSSIYKGEKALNESGQLVVYAIALYQKGIPFERIKIGWNFLKYVSVKCQQANGKSTIREIERNEIGSKLQSNAKMWLKKLGYEDKLLEYLDLLQQTNDIKCLPNDVQEKYTVTDCYVYVDLTPELVQKWTNKIIDTLKEIEEKENLYKETKDEHIFWETEEEVQKQSYYFSTLCSYSPTLHKPYKLYLDKLEKQKDGIVFSNNKNSEDEDMSWLNDL